MDEDEHGEGGGVRLILFDIDGTLIRGGPAKQAFDSAMRRVFGTAGPIDGHDFSGKTDPQIARELLRMEGLGDEVIDEGFPRLWRAYVRELEERLPRDPPEVLPGVRDLLEALAVREDVYLGLLTGNIVEGARLKLGTVGLAGYFSVGAYGSDEEVRERLAGIAMHRARDRWGRPFPPETVVVVGDTPRDVACGRLEGARTVGVATGNYSVVALSVAGPDHLFSDLRNLDEVLPALVP